MPVTSKDTWDIQNDLTVINATVSEAVTAATGTIETLAATTATIPTLNGGTPMVTGGGAISAGNSSSYPTITVGADGAVTIGTQNVSGGAASILDSVTNTSITYAAAANSVKFAYDTAIAANTYAATIAATAFTNAAARADSAYSNAIAYSGNAALAYANAIAFSANASNLGNGTVPEARLTQANATTNGIMRVLDSVVNTSILIAAAANSVKFAYDTAVAANTYAASIADTAFANAALRADAAYSNAIAYSGNAALAYANAVSYADTNAAFRLVAQTISAVWTHSANLIPSANAINLGLTDRRWLIYGTQADFSSNVYIAGNLSVVGNLIVSGTTTTFDSTTLTVDDPIITLGGDTAPGADDNKDRGVEYRWHNGSVAKIGFFGFDDSTGEFTFIPDATNTSEVFSGTVGNVTFTKATLTTAVISGAANTATLNTTGLATLASANITGVSDHQGLSSFFANVIVHPSATTAYLYMRGISNTSVNYQKFLAFQGGAAGSTNRWLIGTASALEAGADAGSNFVINRYNDAGTYQDQTYIDRASGRLFMPNGAYVTGILNVTGLTTLATANITGASEIRANVLATGTSNEFIIRGGGTTNGMFQVQFNNSTAGTMGIAVYRDSPFDSTTRVFSYTRSGNFALSANLAPTTNSINMGNTIGRWIMYANTIDMTGTLTSTANASFTSAADTLVTVSGGAGYGGVYIRASNTTTGAYLFMGNATNNERFRMNVDDNRQLIFSYDSGVTSHLVANATAMYPSGNTTSFGLSNRRWVMYANTIDLTGAVRFASNLWQLDTAGDGRIWFAASSHTYYKAPSSLHVFRGSSDTDDIYLSSNSTIRQFYPTSNTGTSLGATGGRWNVYANTIDTSGSVQVNGTLSTANQVYTTGGQAIYWFQDRTGASSFGLYATSNVARLYTPAGTEGWGVTATGNTYFPNTAYYSSIPLATQSNTLGLAFVIPEAQNGAYSILLDDYNQMKRFVTGAAATWTISNNSTTAYPLGFNFIARNVQANTLTVARGTGVTLRKSGSTTNTDVTIAQWGYVSFVQEDTNVWVASGTY